MFQSTLPTRGATTASGGLQMLATPVSIHAPHTGSDCPTSVNVLSTS